VLRASDEDSSLSSVPIVEDEADSIHLVVDALRRPVKNFAGQIQNDQGNKSGHGEKEILSLSRSLTGAIGLKTARRENLGWRHGGKTTSTMSAAIRRDTFI
jgi:hypothetical protein